MAFRLVKLGFAGGQVYACFNPRIVMLSIERTSMKEGCLSFPGLVLDIERPTVCKVRYTQPNGQTVTKEFTGMTARVVQHEVDHLRGRLFTSYVSKLKLDMAVRKAKKTLRSRE
jgi:peptide deformylase